MKIAGQIVDIENRRIFKGEIEVEDGIIQNIKAVDLVPDRYILPGFIDAHVHIESSMMVPSEFARMAVVHGTVATVSDAHEIANVLGTEGVEYMIANGKLTPFKFYFGAPSCVPATAFETAGAVIDLKGVEQLLAKEEVRYLAEMMNWPGVLNRDGEVMGKIRAARELGKVIDGHAPGLKGEQAQSYASAGISTDHECFSADEALDKLNCGMKIIIREGSAAKNFDALIHLLHDHEDSIMFCSDDKHPDSLEDGHINVLVRRAVEKGIDIFKVLKAACLNPVKHYGLHVGTLREKDPADFIIVKDLISLEVQKTYLAGRVVAENGRSSIDRNEISVINNFSTTVKTAEDYKVKTRPGNIRVIEVLDGQLITNQIIAPPLTLEGHVVSDPVRDILKIAVVNRYRDLPPTVAFVKNFQMKKGAIASSVAHDSHNIIAVGVDDESLARAINLVVQARGGVSVVDGDRSMILELPVAGIMSASDGYEVAARYKAIDKMAKDLGSTLSAPFMTLSFMALLVIPALKLSDQGLFDGTRFEFCDLFDVNS